MWTGRVEIKHNNFVDAVSIRPCQNSFCIKGSTIYVEKRTQTPEFTHYDGSSGTRCRIGRVYNDIKIANNTKINHIIVYFTDLYNAISIERLSSKTNIRKDSRFFNNSL